MTTVITHELIHAFDDCRAKVDFKNIRHVACTEVARLGRQEWESGRERERAKKEKREREREGG